ncbi:MAG: sodium:solute symporter family protein [Planctomycetota bacterium]|nr:sodium:solute symporter family protein [Planctomycetota bacterium]
MTALDYVVLIVYFVAMGVIGVLCMLRIKHQEDFFLGGRSFGKVMQAFAAFGAGTGADNPVTLGRTVYTSGLSGIWSVLLWLFVTPFYWIFGVWYRRMRHITTGDLFVERYESRGLGAAYAVFGFVFYMWYLSVHFSAVSKVCAPLLGTKVFEIGGAEVPIEYVLVPIVAAVVVFYGVLGGLRAAYWTDLIQGIFILLLSVLLIPFGLWLLVDQFGDPATMSFLDGFRIMHERVAPEYFEIIESPRGGEFPLHYIVAITLINLIGIVVHPHFIATGGGSAKSETAARVGLVVGNFMKRLCTVGWALTSLIVLALLAGSAEIADDPDNVWGIASVKILGPLQMGLVGLMLACLLAALMSSADCYMLVTAGLFVRNFYSAYVKSDASEKHYVFVGRVVSFVMIGLAATVSLLYQDVFGQLKITWELTAVFAAVFWVGMFWRRATRTAAWWTAVISASAFFILPILLPVLWPQLRHHQGFVTTNARRTIVTQRLVADADVAHREAVIARWQGRRAAAEAETDPDARSKALEALGEPPEPLVTGAPYEDTFQTTPKAIYWRDGVRPVDGRKLTELQFEPIRIDEGERTVTRTERLVDATPLEGQGFFNFDFLLYDLLGFDLTGYDNATLETLRLPPKIIMPFVLMILLSLITRKNRQETLDRFYVKMKTPTRPDPEEDRRELELSYQDPRRFDHRKLFPRTQLEIQRPTAVDIVGFLLSLLGTFAIIGLAVWVASIGS